MNTLDYDFVRYLDAKKKIDDRALNRRVWDKLSAQLPTTNSRIPLQVLELGAGIGTMVERFVDWGLLTCADYTAVDVEADYIREACHRLNHKKLIKVSDLNPGSLNQSANYTVNSQVAVTFECADIYRFFEKACGKKKWDLGVAHAFMDLVNIAEVVPRFCQLIKPKGLLYLTLNYDGETILLPTVDQEFDQLINQLYNQSMDERIVNGKRVGDSRTGRHLLYHLIKANAKLLAAGSSDWIVFSGPRGYTQDETYFLQFIVHTIYTELKGHASLNQKQLVSWVKRRRDQIEKGELIFIAKQMDVLARVEA